MSSEMKANMLAAKIATIRKDLGYTEKRGHNSHSNYDYVMAVDVAADMGRRLADVGIVISSENIKVSYELVPNSKGGTETEARLEMTYVLTDSGTGEQLRYVSAGQGRDPRDKGIYKALTGCYKYFFIQAFAMPIGDDPEDDRSERASRSRAEKPSLGPDTSPMTDEQCQEIVKLIAATNSEAKRILDYYKVDAIKSLPYGAVKEQLGKKLRRGGRKSTEELSEAASYPEVPPEAPTSTGTSRAE